MFLVGLGVLSLTLTAIPPSNSWCHLVLVYDLIGQELRFYRNGELIGSQTGIIAEASTGNYILGANKFRTGEFLRGFLDEVAVFDFALDDPDDDGNLSDSRIDAHYTAFQRDAAPLLGFSEAAEIAAGGSANLSWKVGDSASSLVIDNGVGDVTAQTTNGEGTITVTPTETTTYTLTVNGLETQEVTITVLRDLEITDCGFGENGDLLVTCRNLIPGRNYFLAISTNLTSFNPISDTITADETGVFTFSDIVVASETALYYRVEEGDAP